MINSERSTHDFPFEKLSYIDIYIYSVTFLFWFKYDIKLLKQISKSFWMSFNTTTFDTSLAKQH